MNTEEKKDLEKLYNIAISKIENDILIININKNKYVDYKKQNKKVVSNKTQIRKTKILSKLNDLNYDETINEEYKEALSKIKKLNFNIKKDFDEKKYDIYCLELNKNLKLNYYINQENGILDHAFHNSEKIDNNSLILDLLCDQIINKNIEEVADHGAIYLEYFLRSKINKKEQYGIFLPRNSGGIFNIIERNLRSSRDDFYKKRNVNKDNINKEYRVISEEWTNLSFEKQKAKIDDILEKNIFRRFNINSSDIVLNRVIQGNRLEFILSDNLNGDFEDNKLFKIEEIFKQKIDSSIELLSIEEKDSNKLRLTNAPKAV